MKLLLLNLRVSSISGVGDVNLMYTLIICQFITTIVVGTVSYGTQGSLPDLR